MKHLFMSSSFHSFYIAWVYRTAKGCELVDLFTGEDCAFFYNMREGVSCLDIYSLWHNNSMYHE